MATDETKLPAIPPIPSNADPQLKTYLAAIDEALKVRLGRTGDPKDRAVTVRELIDAGIAENFLENPFNPNAGTPDNTFVPTTTIELTVPPDVTSFSGTGSFQKIILSWDLAQFPNFAFTEIWRHTSNSIGDATRIDTTRAQVYADTVDAGANFYYWVRHVSTSNIVGQFTSGINVTTSKISNSNVSDFITTGALTAAQIQAGSLTSASGVFGAISANDITAGTLNADRINTNSLDIASKSIADSIGTIGGQAYASLNLFVYSELYRPAFGSENIDNNYPPHIASVTQTTGSDSGETGSIPAITAGSSILGGSPMISYTFTTYDWGSSTRRFIIQCQGSVSGSSTAGHEELELAMVMRATSSSTNYTSTTLSDYNAYTAKSSAGSAIVLGFHMLGFQADLSPNTQYYIWVFGGIDDTGGSNKFYDVIVSVWGLNK